jgi:hypothetical protein
MQQKFIFGPIYPVFGRFGFDFGKISDFSCFLPMGGGAGAQGVQGRWGAGGATHTLFVCLRINNLRISTPWGSIFLTA